MQSIRTKSTPRRLLAAAATLPLVAASANVASAQDAACDFFKDKTVELVVPFDPGGGFDVYGRMVAKFMGDELGAANMIVRNEPGAGGLLATNKTWASEPDGLRIQLMSASGMISSELGGAAGANFKTGEFSWIGRVSAEPDVIVTSPAADIETPDDLKAIAAERKVRQGSSGVGDIDYLEAKLLDALFDLDSDVITGFGGSSEVYASLARDEIDLFTTSFSSADKAAKAESAKLLWVFDVEAAEGIDLPPIGDLVAEEDKPLVRAHGAVVAAGRSIAGPPGIDADRLACLRDAFETTMASEALIEESKNLNRPVAPLGGAETEALIKSVTDAAPEEYVAITKASYAN